MDSTMLFDTKNDLEGEVSSAWFSLDRKYRYFLRRKTGVNNTNTIVWCMLNPSTADAFKLDPTVTRCLKRSKDMGFGYMVVVNLFAFRSTNPKGLFTIEDPIGKDNDYVIRSATSTAQMVVVAWGNHKLVPPRAKRVLNLINNPVYCLEETKDGYPKHPLHLAYTKKPRLYDSPFNNGIPKCDDCNIDMEEYYEASDTGKDGWRCPDCGWSFDID